MFNLRFDCHVRFRDGMLDLKSFSFPVLEVRYCSAVLLPPVFSFRLMTLLLRPLRCEAVLLRMRFCFF